MPLPYRCNRSMPPYSIFFRYWPVKDAGQAAMSSGVPVATIVPPPSPPSGPRSMIWSAHLMTSRLCSMTRTVLPGVDELLQHVEQLAGRRACAGRSSARRGYRSCCRWSGAASSVASFTRWASPPESVVAALAELDIAEADLHERVRACRAMRGRCFEKAPAPRRPSCPARPQMVLPLVAHLERLAVVARARGRRRTGRRRRAGSASRSSQVPSPLQASQRPPLTLKEKRPGP